MKKILAAAAALLVSTSAFAAPIVGTFSMDGAVKGIGTTDGKIWTATGLDFADFLPAETVADPNFEITKGTTTGIFASLFPAGTTGTINDIVDFTTFTGMTMFFQTNTSPSLSFDLKAPLSITRISAANVLIVSGTGMFKLAGYDDTEGAWTLTTQGNNITSFSASSTVPEPGAIALLGLGVVGLAAARRRQTA